MSVIELPLSLRPTGPVGERIDQVRGFRRLSQEAVVDLMAALDPDRAPSLKTFGKWERGVTTPQVTDLVLIARALSFPVELFVVGLDSDGPSDIGPDDPSAQVSRTSPCMTDDRENVYQLHPAA